MNSKSTLMIDYQSVAGKMASWIFGIVVMAIGILNTFWGNDAGFGIFVILLSFIFLPPVNAGIKNIFGFSFPLIVKILIAAFIIWAALGVGELFGKIDLMLMDLR